MPRTATATAPAFIAAPPWVPGRTIAGWCGALESRRRPSGRLLQSNPGAAGSALDDRHHAHAAGGRSEEHTSELQSRENLVCRLLLEKKKKKKDNNCHTHQRRR